MTWRAAVAAEIVRLLALRRDHRGPRSVGPGDIAVLCRTNEQARSDAGRRCARSRCPSVLQGDASVFDSLEAASCERVLRGDGGSGRRGGAARGAGHAALAASSGADLSRCRTTSAAGTCWVRRFQALARALDEQRIHAGVPPLLDEHRDAPPRLLALPDGERRLTNVLHLGELLQRRRWRAAAGRWRWSSGWPRCAPTQRAAARWSARRRRSGWRATSSALKLLTIHKSKGLEYPIVFCPSCGTACSCTAADKDCLRFHDADDGNR